MSKPRGRSPLEEPDKYFCLLFDEGMTTIAAVGLAPLLRLLRGIGDGDSEQAGSWKKPQMILGAVMVSL